MAPTKPSKGKGKPSGKAGGASKKRAKPTGSAPSGISKRKSKSLSLAKPGGAQKTKSRLPDGRKKKRVYSEAELDIPKLNGIVPAGIAKPKGQKKGKKFVDDQDSMMAIMSVVNAEKEGQVESKIMRARQLEEVREAKRKEQEKRSDEKKQKFEDKKESIRKGKKQRHSDPARVEDFEKENQVETSGKPAKKNKKRVSFG